MSKLFKLFTIASFVLFLSGCAIHTGYMDSSAALGEAGFSYTQTSISGSASTLRVLGIGGLSKQAIVEEAKMDMLKNNPLKDDQALANVTVNWKYSFYVVVQTTSCTVTADVVEFEDD